ncbi:MAG: extracellular solute-binding protein [Gammaproteobacteria bacterium]|nr:extracellular solute-binding protein [Gammaproteobacteria bacterium]
MLCVNLARRTILVVLASLLFTGATRADNSSFILQSTTSTANSGLYDYLLPMFRKKSGITVNVVAVGTGQAIRNAKNGDGDVLLVHAKAAEEKFVAGGYGVERFDVMYNDFIFVGPPADPAGVKDAKIAVEGLQKIAAAGALFASRGDNSGTYKKEMALWKSGAIDPKASSGKWYRETGSGMGATLNAAVGMGAYSMTDRGTWISFRNKGDYEIVLQGDPGLFNPYGIILINPNKHPRVKAEAGQAFIDWILSAEGQDAIAAYKLGGKQLFFPNAN